MPPEMARRYPYITELAMAVSHDEESVVGPGCDDRFEFELALDLLLDGSNGSAAGADVNRWTVLIVGAQATV